MKQLCFITACFLILFCSNLKSQTISGGIAGDLEGMFSRIRENRSSPGKLAINDSIRKIVENYAVSDTVFSHKFSNLRFLGQITSPDSLVKIISWNLILDDGGNRYFCYFIKRAAKGEKSNLYKLSGIYKETPIRSDTIYSESNWYGALYYDIKPFVSEKDISYILLGIDYGNSFITRKLIEVLNFGPNGKLTFGKKIFADGKVLMPRIVFEYTATAVMSLRFIDNKTIVFDHLSPVSPEYSGNRQFYGPDFSYDSYNLENGLWRLKSNIDIRIKEK
jgi:hypothetical protein